MAKRSNGEGTYGKKKIKGTEYFFYRDPDGKYTYGRTQSDLKRKICEKKNKKFVVLPKTTFGDYIREWLTLKEGTIQQSTYDDYEDIIYNMITNFKGYDLENVQIANLSQKVFQSYLNALAKKYAKSSIIKAWAVIKQCVKYGEVNDELPEKTIEFVKIPKEVAVPKKEIQFYTKDQADLLYSCLEFKCNNGVYKYKNNRNAHILIFIMYSGVRVAEATALKWKNVDMENHTIRIVESAAKIKDRSNKSENKYINIDKVPKSKDSIRTIPIPKRGMEMLEYYRDLYPNHKLGDYVFLNSNNNKIDTKSVNKTLKSMAKDVDLPQTSVHGLRHSYGSMLLEGGVDIKKVSELLGHSDITVTYNIYIGVTDEGKREAVESVFDS